MTERKIRLCDCGGEAAIHGRNAISEEDPSLWFVSCTKCWAEGPWCETRDEAISRHNHRMRGLELAMSIATGPGSGLFFESLMTALRSWGSDYVDGE